MLNIIPIPAFKDNYIWALHDRQHAVVVDPGDAAPVRAWLDVQQLKLAAVLCTHHHDDHVGGVCELAQLYNVPVYGPRHENIPCISHAVGEGDVVEITELGIQLKVFDIPGHTRGHVAYLISGIIGNAGALFCGDTLFGCGCGRLFEGTAAQLHHSLQHLAQLPDDTQVYCAHEYTEANIRFALACEPSNVQLKQRQENAHALRAAGQPTLPSTVALEKATNPFLRCTEPEIIHTLHQHGLTDNTKLAVFTAMREWKNHF
jgi:hydroxyacylglutathione hydrolase